VKNALLILKREGVGRENPTLEGRKLAKSPPQVRGGERIMSYQWKKTVRHGRPIPAGGRRIP
jgi:hypothetical protein